jgi:uroporphyrinogen-III decarboxylase
MDLCDHPDLMEVVLEAARRVMIEHVKAFLASPSEVAWLDICWATGAHMGPKHFERWALPDVIQTMEVVRQRSGKFMGLYTLGRMRQLLPMLVDTGVHFIETFEPNEGDLSLGEAKARYGDRICIMGNFDCNVLAFGDVEDARRETLRCLREGMEGGGYILVTADEVPANAKWENLKAMVEVVEEFGRYS